MNLGCAEVRDLLQPFLDGELEVERSVTILKHLELCPPCRGRVDDERQLHALVPRACRAPVEPATCRRLLDACYDRCAAQELADAAADAAARPRRWLRLLLAGLATALLAGTAAVVVTIAPHARCYFFGDCPTRRIVAVAHHRSELDSPLPLEQVEDCQGLCPPVVGGLTLVGANPLVLAGHDVGPLLRYRCNCDRTEVVLFRLANAHLHSWQMAPACDGLDYATIEEDGTRVLAWQCDESGGIWCMMGPADRLPQPRLLALASPLRHHP